MNLNQFFKSQWIIKRFRELGVLCFLFSCSTSTELPEQKIKKYSFPKGEAYLKGDTPKKNSDSITLVRLGLLKVKVNFSSLNERYSFDELCRNYFNKALQQLVQRAKKEKNAFGVMDIESVVYLMNGQVEYYTTAECADDGSEGQILVQGQAFRWQIEEDSNKHN